MEGGAEVIEGRRDCGWDDGGGTNGLLPGIPDTLGALLGAWDGGRVDGRLQLSDSEGHGESVAEGVSDPGTDEGVAKSLGPIGGCATKLSRLRRGVSLRTGLATADEEADGSRCTVEDIGVDVSL